MAKITYKSLTVEDQRNVITDALRAVESEHLRLSLAVNERTPNDTEKGRLAELEASIAFAQAKLAELDKE